jgi:hypothetical protein
MKLAERLAEDWQSRLKTDLTHCTHSMQVSMVQWLLGADQARFDELAPTQLAVAQQAMDYRYRILRERYLGVGPERAYQRLIQRLSSLFLIRSKIKTWIALSRDRQRSVVDVLQEVIQELLQNDNYMQQQLLGLANARPIPGCVMPLC